MFKFTYDFPMLVIYLLELSKRGGAGGWSSTKKELETSKIMVVGRLVGLRPKKLGL
jgi:hypothetical protein